jgi:hypothetical protein
VLDKLPSALTILSHKVSSQFRSIINDILLAVKAKYSSSSSSCAPYSQLLSIFTHPMCQCSVFRVNHQCFVLINRVLIVEQQQQCEQQQCSDYTDGESISESFGSIVPSVPSDPSSPPLPSTALS